MMPTSTHNNSTNMSPIDKAVEDFKLQEPGEELLFTKFAEKYGAVNQQKLNPQQELELVGYIRGLTKKGLPLTREMVQNSASHIVKEPVGEGWVIRFMGRNSNHLTSQWTARIDAVHHQADSEGKYNLYFNLLYQKIQEYNMDEKGFLVGITGRSKRIFSKQMWEKKEVRASL
ncbi:hypothetical protein EJ02DRAFT_475240 [Clathrospora elynae]|uniref:HTH CENPB-type domain-containing protein n=1 Tax=Clathrospora elynae TaxID=706981 RepID=A0A6A5SBH5_9PLEO|nr:hypothetical protein EJ02DRAFT_475240 [Clathrospora elynae]